MRAGATGTLPDGISRRSGDEGALNIAISDKDSDGLIHVDFGKPIAWFAMPSENAINLAKMILRKAGAKSVTVEF